MSIYDNIEDGVKNMEKIVVAKTIVSTIVVAAGFQMVSCL
jgi:hypothetical protein